MKLNIPFQFGYIPYPLWRRHWPAWAKPLLEPIWHAVYPVKEDRNPPADAAEMTHYLARFDLLPHMDEREILLALEKNPAEIEHTPNTPPILAPEVPIRIPAQWEPMEAVIINWPVIYPPLWELHAQMVEAIGPVAEVIITVPAPMWGQAVHLYLSTRENANTQLDHVRIFNLPTNDIWVRDHGPFVGYDAGGQCLALNAIYDHLPQYPQMLDNELPLHWAAHTGVPVRPLDIHTEGGNLWSDGAGTLIMTNQIFNENPNFSRKTLERYLHSVFDFEKLIITPCIELEHTGHVDLLVKLADAQTILISAPTTHLNAARMDELRDVFLQETNARGQRYTVVELPAPPLYFNWFAYPIHRSYTNSLTVNGRVLVPVYGTQEDEAALRIYEATMPGYEIIPIDCKIGANGGGAVHCMTKEIPTARNNHRGK